MNKMYADRNGKQTDTKESVAVNQARKLIERQKAAKEKSAHIIDYYTNGQQKGMRI